MSAAGRLQTIERLGIIMKFLDAEFVQGFIRMADDGWQQGWHERNGGNLSYRVKPEEVELVTLSAEKTRGFYEALGFHVERDMIIMEKRLSKEEEV